MSLSKPKVHPPLKPVRYPDIAEGLRPESRWGWVNALKGWSWTGIAAVTFCIVYFALLFKMCTYVVVDTRLRNRAHAYQELDGREGLGQYRSDLREYLSQHGYVCNERVCLERLVGSGREWNE